MSNSFAFWENWSPERLSNLDKWLIFVGEKSEFQTLLPFEFSPILDFQQYKLHIAFFSYIDMQNWRESAADVSSPDS